MFDDDEEVVYLEVNFFVYSSCHLFITSTIDLSTTFLQHGCDYDSFPLSPAKRRMLQSHLSVTENDYLAVEHSAPHQEAPKFVRKNIKNKNDDNGISRQHKRKSSPALDMLDDSSQYVSMSLS